MSRLPSWSRPASLVVLVAGLALPLALPAQVPETQFEDSSLPARTREALSRYAQTVRTWAMVQRIAEAVVAQNGREVPIERVEEIDRAWAAEEEPSGLAQELATNECARALQSLVSANPGYVVAFVADAQGALVCMTSRPPSYWQWRDPRFFRAFDEGRGAVFVSARVIDPATQAALHYLSAPIMREGRAAGVLVVGRIVDGPGD
jgi:hypothetical protein